MSGLPLPIPLPRGRRERDEAERAVRIRFESALSAGRVGTWRWDVTSGRADWDGALEALFGLEPNTFEGTYQGYTRRIHEDDLPFVESALDRALREEQDQYGVEHRIVLPDGTVRWVEVVARVIRDADGRPVEMAGIVLDADGRRRLEDERAAAVSAAFGAQRALDAAQRRLRILDRASELLSSAEGAQDAAQHVADLLVDELADWCLVETLDGDRLRPLAQSYRDSVAGEIEPALRALATSPTTSPTGAEAVFVADLAAADLDTVVCDEAHRSVVRALRMPGSYMRLPLVAHGETLGTITLLTGNGWQLDSEDKRVARELAHRTATLLVGGQPRLVPTAAASEAEREAARLEAVRRYDILETPPDGAFDRITAMAARLFHVPIAIVSIVDRDRIWFKSHHGVGMEEIGRDPGLCASAILQDGPWVVPNAVVDPRTLTNPLVAGELGLRFYAGVPLTTYDGHNLGTLCIIDQEPREMSESDLATLTDLAGLVMDELELRRLARVHAGIAPTPGAEQQSA